MRNRRAWLAALCLLTGAAAAEAQILTTLFPEGVPGYGTGPGVTVQSRARPEYDPLGIRIDTLTIQPLLSLSTGYDDNVFTGPTHVGSWEAVANPSVLVNTRGSYGSVAAYVSANDVHYLTEPSQDRVDADVFLGGTYNFGRDVLTLGAAYLARHEDRTALDALPSDRPVAFTVANARAAYAAAFGPFTLTPSIDLNRWRFDNTTILGRPVSEASRDRSTVQLGTTLRYEWMTARDMVLVTRVLDTHYDEPTPGAPSNNSLSWQALFGIDYDNDTVWRYEILGGVEYRQPASSAIAPQTAGIAEAEVVWSPSGMTTVRFTANRGIEDAAQTGLSSFTYTSAEWRVDHELTRAVLLDVSAIARQATFNQTGGQQFGVGLGAGITWLLNRKARLSLTYDFSDVRNSHLPAGVVAGDYTRDLTLLTLRIGL
jgi:hypothetical protein